MRKFFGGGRSGGGAQIHLGATQDTSDGELLDSKLFPDKKYLYPRPGMYDEDTVDNEEEEKGEDDEYVSKKIKKTKKTSKKKSKGKSNTIDNHIPQAPFHPKLQQRRDANEPPLPSPRSSKVNRDLSPETVSLIRHYSSSNSSAEELHRILQQIDAVKFPLESTTGQSPLHIACFHEAGDVVQILISHGFDPNIRDKEGNTPLHLSCLVGGESSMKSLFLVGEDGEGGVRGDMEKIVTIRNKGGYTPLDMLVLGCNASDSSSFRSCFRLLYSSFCLATPDPAKIVDSPHPKTGITSLILAAAGNNLKAVRILTDDLEACVDASDTEGKTALTHAVIYGHWRVAELLGKKGGGSVGEFVDVRDKDGFIVTRFSSLTAAICRNILNEKEPKGMGSNRKKQQRDIVSTLVAEVTNEYLEVILAPLKFNVIGLCAFVNEAEMLQILIDRILNGGGVEKLIQFLFPKPPPPPPAPPKMKKQEIESESEWKDEERGEAKAGRDHSPVNLPSTNKNYVLCPLHAAILNESLSCIELLLDDYLVDSIVQAQKMECEEEAFVDVSEEAEEKLRMQEKEEEGAYEKEEKDPEVEVCFAPDGSVVVRRGIKPPRFVDGSNERAAQKSVAYLESEIERKLKKVKTKQHWLKKLIFFEHHTTKENCLLFAVSNGRFSSVDFILNSVINGNLFDSSDSVANELFQSTEFRGRNIFHLACEARNLSVLELLLSAIGGVVAGGTQLLYDEDKSGHSPMSVAISTNDIEIVRCMCTALAESRADDVFEAVRGDSTAAVFSTKDLVEGLKNGVCVEVFNYMLEELEGDSGGGGGARNGGLFDVNTIVSDDLMNDPLAIICAKSGRADILRFATEKWGLDLNAKNNKGFTAFLVAAEMRSMDVFDFLANESEVDTEICDILGNNAFHLIAMGSESGEYGYNHAEEDDRMMLIMSRLPIELLSAVNRGGETPLMVAVDRADVSTTLRIIRFGQSRGSDLGIDAVHEKKGAALNTAIRTKNKRVVEALISSCGASLVNKKLKWPLIFDVIAGLDIEFLKYFLKVIGDKEGGNRKIANLLRSVDENGENVFFHIIDGIRTREEEQQRGGDDEEDGWSDEEEEDDVELRDTLIRAQNPKTLIDIFDLLFELPDIDFFDILEQRRSRDGRGLIHLAAANKDMGRVKLLIEKGKRSGVEVAKQVDNRKQTGSAIAAKLGATKVSIILHNAATATVNR